MRTIFFGEKLTIQRQYASQTILSRSNGSSNHLGMHHYGNHLFVYKQGW